MNRNKLFAVLAALFMLAVPLMVIDPNCIVSNGVADNGNTTESTNDFTWTEVTDFTDLKNKMSLGGNLKLTQTVHSNGGTIEVPAGTDVYVNLNGYDIEFDGTPADSPNAMVIKGSAAFVYGDDNANKGKIDIGSTYKGISVVGKLGFYDMVMSESSSVADSAISADGGRIDLDYVELTATKHAVAIGENGGTVTINGGTYSSTDGATFYDRGKSGTHNLTINAGNINASSGGYSLSVTKTDDAVTDLVQIILIRSGTFGGKIESISTTTQIRGGIFNGDLDTDANNHYKIFMGRFASTNDVSAYIDLDEDAGSVWVPATESKMTYNEVFQKDSCMVQHEDGTVEYYADLEKAFNDSNDGSVIQVRRAGTYILDFQYCHSSKIKGVVDGVVLDGMNMPHYVAGSSIDIENVTFKRANQAYLGFCESANEKYTNVTFTTLIYAYASNNIEFNNCVFYQPRADFYSVQIYDGKHITFNNCTFNCMGKAIMLYVDDAVDEANKRICDVINCSFYDKGHVQNKAAVEIHTEHGYTENYTWWQVNIKNTSVSGFYKTSFGDSKLYSAVNNVTKTKSTTSLVYIDGAMDYPTKATFTVTLTSNGETTKTFTDVKYDDSFTKVDVPVNEGYIFKGYYDETFTKQYFDENGNPMLTWDVRANGTLYALWVKDTSHNITFDMNGGTGTAPQTMSVKEQSEFQLPGATFTLEGFKFVGWSDGVNTYLTTEKYIMGTSDLALKAVWSKGYQPIAVVEYTNVSLMIEDENGISIPDVNVYIDGVNDTLRTDDDGTVRISSIKSGLRTVHCVSEPNLDKTVSVEFTNNNETKTITLKDFSIKTVVDSSDSNTSVAVNGLEEVGETFKDGDVTNVKVTVKVDNSDETKQKAAANIEKTKQESGKSDCMFFDVSLWVSKNDGVAEQQLSVTKYIEVIIPFNATVMNEGYEVYHCHTDESGVTTIYKLGTEPTAGCNEYYQIVGNEMHVFLMNFSEITINYTPNGYNGVTFDVNGGDKAAPSPLSYIEGQTFTLPSYDGTKGGESFKGWECNGITYKAGDTVTMSGSDMKFTAVWTDTPGPQPEPKAEQNVLFVSLLVILAILSAMEILYFARKH